MTTVVLVFTFGGLLIAGFVLFAAFLALGLKTVRAPGVKMRDVLRAAAVIAFAQFAIAGLFHGANAWFEDRGELLAWAEAMLSVVVQCSLVARFFSLNLGRAVLAWLIALVSIVPETVLVLGVVQPFLFESFAASSNPMAPTLVGDHNRGRCPECEAVGFCVPRDPRFDYLEGSETMICENFHVTTVEKVDEDVFAADRFLAARFLESRRWDVITFRLPQDPSVMYVMRLIGLPGETIHIEDGSVYANGRKLVPPEELTGIEYETENGGFVAWGSPETPAVLADDEYFVLGDFSARSQDSRFWRDGARGHAPYAVPESHLHGVVTHVYWPPRRATILR